MVELRVKHMTFTLVTRKFVSHAKTRITHRFPELKRTGFAPKLGRTLLRLLRADFNSEI